MAEMRYCEFTGDEEHAFDEVGYKKVCKHIGFTPVRPDDWLCLKYKQPLKRSLQGWRMCCDECDCPVQVKELEDG